MLRGLMLADENDRDLPSIALFENRIFVDVDLVQRRPELAEQGCDGGFGLLTKVTSGTRVQGDVARATGGQPRIFGHDAQDALGVNLLEGGEMRQDFGDGPAVRPGFQCRSSPGKSPSSVSR